MCKEDSVGKHRASNEEDNVQKSDGCSITSVMEHVVNKIKKSLRKYIP
jgi:hypothetical protein